MPPLLKKIFSSKKTHGETDAHIYQPSAEEQDILKTIEDNAGDITYKFAQNGQYSFQIFCIAKPDASLVLCSVLEKSLSTSTEIKSCYFQKIASDGSITDGKTANGNEFATLVYYEMFNAFIRAHGGISRKTNTKNR